MNRIWPITLTVLLLSPISIPATIFSVTITNDSGAGSLRQAILDANGSAGADVIQFNIPSGGLTIIPTNALPTITDPLTIDGTTQPGFAGTPLIELNGQSAGAGGIHGLRISAGNSVVRGLIINRFTGHGIEITTNGNNVVEGCIIGLDVASVDRGNNFSGIFITNTANNVIGGINAAQRNVLSGNGQNGVGLSGIGATNNIISGNFIGLNIPGTAGRNNSGQGIHIIGSPYNLVGGTNNGSRNLISGNSQRGVQVDGTNAYNNRIIGNFIGLDVTGTTNVANGTHGIHILNASTNIIGGTNISERNVVSGNSQIGVSVEGTTAIPRANVILGNFIGTDVSGELARANSFSGIHFVNASANRVGGIEAGEANWIRFNGVDGVLVQLGTNNVIRGNSIFSNGQQGIDLGNNSNDGVTPNDLDDVDTGGGNHRQNFPILSAATNNNTGGITIAGSLNSRPNTFYEIDFFSNVSMDASSYGEGQVYLGSTTAATAANGNTIFLITLTNTAYGRYISATATDPQGNTSEFSPCVAAASTIPPITFTVVNTNDSGPGSLRQAILDANIAATDGADTIAFDISGAGPHTNRPASQLPSIYDAVVIDGFTQPGASTNTLSNGNNAVWKIVLDGQVASGTAGLRLESSNNIIRGLVIIRFPNNGIEITTNGNNKVEGNLIGLGLDNSARGNVSSGIYVNSSPDNFIGGTAPAARNVISGNGQSGIYMNFIGATNNLIQGNYIGTDLNGTLDRGNSADGITVVNAANNVIGGAVPGAGNLISGNNNDGIELNSIGATNNFVLGNLIGTDLTGTLAIANGVSGINISNARFNSIGGTNNGEANRIYFNVGDGVSVVSPGTNNAIRANAFFANGDLAIDLNANGLTPNDVGDADTGANQLQNFPILSAATNYASSIFISGSLNGRPNTVHYLDFYSNVSRDPSTNGEGQVYLGSTAATTDGGGNVNFSVTLANAAYGRYIAATATDSFGNTSEFSPCLATASTLPPVTFTVVNTNDSGAGSLRQAILDANLAITDGADTIAFNILGAGPHTNRPASELPPIYDAVIIDGFTQTNASANTLSNGNNAIWKVVLDGAVAGANAEGLRLESRGSSIRGLAIIRFTGHGIEISGDGNNTVEGNLIGLGLDNSDLGNALSGVSITNSSGNVIGGTAPAARNILSGNNQNGFGLIGGIATNNLILGNYIGTDSSGTLDRGNNGDGVSLVNGAYNVIGGTVPGAGNLISGNGSDGIELNSAGTTNNLVQGNFIGTDLTGTLPLGNTSPGINISSARFNTIGGTNGGEGNRIYFNLGDGVSVAAGTNNAIRGNAFFGNGDLAIDLGANGKTLNDAGDVDTGANQLQNFPILSGATNHAGSISISGSLNSRPNIIHQIDFYSTVARDPSTNGEGQVYLGSTVATTDGGGNVSFSATLASTAYGRFIAATATDSFGNTSEFSPCLAAASSIPPVTFIVTTTNDNGPGSLRQAILDANAAATDGADTIVFNITEAGPHTNRPASELPPILDPVVIDGFTQPGASANTLSNGNDAVWRIVLDGVNAGAGAEGLRLESSGNVVRGLAIIRFQGNGIEVVEGNNTIAGNLIGLGLDGSDQGNINHGISLNSPDNTIGGTAPSARNIISGNNLNGISSTSAFVTNNLIQGNYIGTDPSGTLSRGNSQNGINLSGASYVIIGGVGAGAGNLISGNNGGISLPNGTNHLIQGNYIGTDVSGTLDLGNNGDGINLSSTINTVIGGATPGSANLISGNNNDGIEINGINATNNSVLGNRIGTDFSGSLALGNNSHGVNINARFNRIGGTNSGEGNRIYFNGLDAVSVANSVNNTNNAIRANAAFGNGDLGIDLANNGKSNNDLNDGDAGPNQMQNFPILTAATINSNSVAIQGTLNNRPSGVYELDFFANSIPDPGTNGEAQIYLGTATVTTDGTGNTNFNIILPASGITWRFIAATATDTNGNTSELSPCVRANTTLPPLTFTVVNTNDSGPGSFRQAILDNNASATATNNLIAFNIPGAGPHIIQPAIALPILTESATIDGYTQPGAIANTQTNGNNAVIKIQLDGALIGSDTGLRLQNAPSVVRGLCITEFSGDAIELSGSGGHVIEGNFIGLETDGLTARGSGRGIYISGSSSNRIGGESTSQANIIADNGEGVRIQGVTATNNTIQGNFIGIDRSGTLARGNNIGIWILDGQNNLIGGTTTGARNIISDGIRGVYMEVSASFNIVQGNFFGTDVSGTLPLGNGQAIYIGSYLGSGNIIGGTAPGAGNIIAFSSTTGIQVADGTNNAIRLNSIFSNGDLGIDLGFGFTANDTGDADSGPNQLQNFPVLTNAFATTSNVNIQGALNSRPNATFFLDFFSNPQCDNSGKGEGYKYLGSTTVITDGSGNVGFDVTFNQLISGRHITATATDADGNTSEFSPCLPAITTLPPLTFTVLNTNDSGTGSLRQALLDNNNSASSSNNLIAFNIPGPGPHIVTPLTRLPQIDEAVTIDGFTQSGSSANTLTNGNNAIHKVILIGTNDFFGDGLRLAASSNIVRGLVLLGWNQTAILIGSRGNVIEGNLIGTDAAGSTNYNNGYNGIYVLNGPGNLIGGNTPAARNVISGHRNYGIYFYNPPASSNIIQGNFIGVSPNGTSDLGNGAAGIYTTLGASGNIIGGANPNARNIISGNDSVGIQLYNATSTVIQGNFIGTDVNGLASIPNRTGIYLDYTQDTQIGGVGPAGNLISGNSQEGIYLYFNSSSNRIQGNFIGTDVSGASPLGNVSAGVSLQNTCVSNLVGGNTTPEGNIIAFNGAEGVEVGFNSANNAIRRNSIFSNGGLGISLSFGVTINDVGDADTGPNNLQNYPILTAAVVNPANVQIQGSLNSISNTIYTLDFFANQTCDASGYGEGQQYLGSTNVTTDGSGNVTFAVIYSVSTPYANMTATATDPAGNTSEFSPCFAGSGTLPPMTFTVVNTNDSGPGSLRQAILDSGDFAALTNHTIAFNIPGTNLHIISPLSPLPVPRKPVIIDGFTQPTASTATDTNTDNAVRKIRLNGSLAGFSADGLRFTNNGNIVRGLEIRRFAGEGIELAGASNVIEGCFITTNNSYGILINNSVGNLVGGTAPSSRNTVSGNNNQGIEIAGPAATANLVQGNLLGIDPSATAALPNNGAGVRVNGAPANIIGGSATTRNVIGGNNGSGVVIVTLGADGNLVQGNYIGVTPLGAKLGNSGDGVTLNGGVYNNVVGEPHGSGSSSGGNIIAFNQLDGVFVTHGTNNAIRANRIFSNTQLGIDLDINGVTFNDLNDPDIGANWRQNFPIITNALITTSNVIVQGTLNSRPSTSYQIDFYRGVIDDDSYHGEGEYWLGSAFVTTDASGNAVFSASVSNAGIGVYVSCTATDPAGNTSEFSRCLLAIGSMPPQTFTITNTNDDGPGSLRDIIRIVNITPASGPHIVNVDLPETGPQRLYLLSSLEPIVNAVDIFFSNAGGSSLASGTKGVGTSAAGPEDDTLIINGRQATTTLGGRGGAIKGLTFVRGPCRFDNATFEECDFPDFAIWNSGFSANNVNQARMLSVNIDGGGDGNGIGAERDANVEISDSTFIGCANAVQVTGSGSGGQIRVTGCTFEDCQNAISGSGFISLFAQDNTWTRNNGLLLSNPNGGSAPSISSAVRNGSNVETSMTISGGSGSSNATVEVEILGATQTSPDTVISLGKFLVTLNTNGTTSVTITSPAPANIITVSAAITRNGNNTSSCGFFQDVENGELLYGSQFECTANLPQSGEASDPINTFTGEFYDSLPPDLHLGGPMPLFFQRFYGTRLKPDGHIEGRLGENWLHNFEMKLTNKVSSVEVALYPGMFLVFTNQSGNYFLQTRNDIKFELRTNGTDFVVGDPRSQRLFTFNSAGQLTKIEDGHGNTHTLTYASGNLTTVSDGLGRTLNFQYAATGLLTNVTDGTRSAPFQQIANQLGITNLLGASTTPLGFSTLYDYVLPDTNYPTPLLYQLVLPETNTPLSTLYNTNGQATSQQADAPWFMSYFGGATLVRDPQGNDATHNHSSNGLLTAWSDPTGQTISMGYNTNGQRISVTDRLGNTTQLAYDPASGYISAITNADGKVTTFIYTNRTANGVTFYDVRQIQYPDGTTTTFTRDANGNVTSRVDRAGQISQFSYNSRGQLLTATNPAGGVVTYTYNPDGTVASSRDSEIGITTYSYDSLKRLTNIIHPDSSTHRFVYDADDRLVSRTDERNNTTQFIYDKNGRLTETIDANSQTNRFVYDSRNRLVRAIDPLGNSTRRGFDNRGLPSAITNRNGFKTTFTYDKRQRLISLTDPANQQSRFAYDQEGRLVVTTNANAEVNRLKRDALGYITSSTNPLGHSVSYQFDVMRRLTNLIDQLGRSYTYQYDQRGLLTNSTHPGIGSAGFTRNSLGLLTRIKDLNAKEWNFDYSPMGRLQSARDPLNRTNSYTYDSRGRRHRTIFADGVNATNTYDSANNLIRRQFSDGTDFQYAYDNLNRLTNAGGTGLAYDAQGRLTSDTSAGVTFGASYDAGGRLTNVTYNGGLFSVTYTYDNRNRLTSVSDSLTGTQLNFAYDNVGRLTNIARPNNINSKYTYDAAGRLTRIQEGNTSSNLIDITYTLDAASQVLSANFNAPLDPANFASASVNNFTYDNAHQINNAGYTYDTRGRLRIVPGKTFTFDGASRLTAINGVALGYDALGDLITRTESGTTTRFFHHRALGMSPIVAERNESTSQVLRYYIWSPGGTLLYMIDAAGGNAVRHFHFDRVGTTLALTDTSGNVTDAYAWTSYGQLLGRTGTNPQPFTYVGRYGVRHEPAANLFHMRARYYDPVTARFLSKDPIWPAIRDLKDLNPYQYAAENPLNYIDPGGLVRKGIGGANGKGDYCDTPGHCVATEGDCDPNTGCGSGECNSRVRYESEEHPWHVPENIAIITVHQESSACTGSVAPDDFVVVVDNPKDAGTIGRLRELASLGYASVSEETLGELDAYSADIAGSCTRPVDYNVPPLDTVCLNYESSNADEFACQALQSGCSTDSCVCPDHDFSDLYVNGHSKVTNRRVRRPQLVQEGARTPAICSFEEISVGLDTALNANGPGHSLRSRVILDNMNDAFE